MPTVPPLAAVLLAAVPPALVASVVTRRWPHRDPMVPRLTSEQIADEVHRHPRLAALLRARIDPATETGLLLSAAVGGVVVAVSAVGLLARMISSDSGLAQYDLVFARWGANNASRVSTEGLIFLSRFGGYEFLVVATVIVAVLEFRRGLGRSVVPFLVLVVGGQFALVGIIKSLVDRDRPDISRLTGFSGTSFPSGHAASATAAFAAFSLLLGRRRTPTVKAALAALATALATVVAGTRVVLGVHWFTDVLAGAGIGWSWFSLVSIAFGGRVLRFGLPVVEAEATALHEPHAEADSGRSR